MAVPKKNTETRYRDGSVLARQGMQGLHQYGLLLRHMHDWILVTSTYHRNVCGQRGQLLSSSVSCQPPGSFGKPYSTAIAYALTTDKLQLAMPLSDLQWICERTTMTTSAGCRKVIKRKKKKREKKRKKRKRKKKENESPFLAVRKPRDAV